jgi:hypothetical protein
MRAEPLFQVDRGHDVVAHRSGRQIYGDDPCVAQARCVLTMRVRAGRIENDLGFGFQHQQAVEPVFARHYSCAASSSQSGRRSFDPGHRLQFEHRTTHQLRQ